MELVDCFAPMLPLWLDQKTTNWLDNLKQYVSVKDMKSIIAQL